MSPYLDILTDLCQIKLQTKDISKLELVLGRFSRLKFQLIVILTFNICFSTAQGPFRIIYIPT